MEKHTEEVLRALAPHKARDLIRAPGSHAAAFTLGFTAAVRLVVTAMKEQKSQTATLEQLLDTSTALAQSCENIIDTLQERVREHP